MNISMITSPVASNTHTIYRFRGKAWLDDVRGVTLRAFADSRYKLYINGKYVAEGPAIGSVSYYDEFTTDLFRVGENEIEAEVLYANGFIGSSALLRKSRVAFSLVAERDGKTLFATDKTWETALDKTRNLLLVRVHPNGYTNEEYKPKPLVWQNAIPYSAAYKERNSWGCFGIYPEIKKSILPFHTPEAAQAFTVSKAMTSGLAVGSTFTGMTVRAGETRDVVLSAGVHTVGYPSFALSGTGRVKLMYAESYRKKDAETGYYLKGVRSDSTGDIVDDAFDTVTLQGESAVFTPYLERTFRFIRVTVEAESDFTVGDASFAVYNYPLCVENAFCSSDAQYNRIFEVSVRTLRNCTFDTYVDCPYYEMQQYAEDAYLEMMYTMLISSDYRMPKKLMLDLWQSRNHEGLMTAAAPMAYRQITPTFNIFFFSMVSDYLLYTGDAAFVEPFLPALYDVLEWFKKKRNADGVVGVLPYGLFIDWVNDWVKDGWKDNFYVPYSNVHPASIYSLMYLYGLRLAIALFRRFGRDGVASDLVRDYDALSAAIERVFYDGTRGMYKDRKDGGFSEHSQIFAVLSGLAVGDKASRALRGCEEKDVAKCSYSYRFFKNRALDAAAMDFDMENFLGDWYAMLADDATTWFELPGHTRSDCHGWSSVPIYEFTTKILGLTPAAEGMTAVNVAPTFYRLTHASGTLPTKDGGVHLAFRKDGDVYRVTVDSPERIEKRIRMKDGSILVTKDAHVEYTV